MNIGGSFRMYWGVTGGFAATAPASGRSTAMTSKDGKPWETRLKRCPLIKSMGLPVRRRGIFIEEKAIRRSSVG